MAEIVNLNRARKTKAKAEAEKTAADNRVKHGTPKALRRLRPKPNARKPSRIEARRLDGDTKK